jgi:hypothetical protein
MHPSIAEEISGGLYMDGSKWKGWSKESNTYYFDDIGCDTIVEEMDLLDKMSENQKGVNNMKCNDCDEKATQEVDNMYFCDECVEEYETEK